MTAESYTPIRLQVLGPVRVQRPGGQQTASILTQPRRVAVLAYLTLARPRGLHSRDTVVALLWPESDDAGGRHALRNALHAIRSTLGDSVIATAGDGLVGVDPAHVACDALELEALAAEGKWAAAVATYEGELLQGFHVSDAPGFERWLDAERVRVREIVCAAAWSWAEECQRRGDMDGALQAGKRAVDLAPDDEIAIRRLLDLARLGGDRATALRAYERFADHLAKEFDAEPSAETQRVVRLLRETPPTAPIVSPALVGRDTPSPVGSPRPTVNNAPAAPTDAPPAQNTTNRRRLRIGLAAVAVVTLMMLVSRLTPATRVVPRAELFSVGTAARLTTDDGLEIQPEISPDGRFVAYAAGNSVRMRIFVHPLGGSRMIPLSDDSTSLETAPRWSPDGTQILYLSRGGVRVSPALSGQSRTIVPGGGADTVLSAAWSPDGQEIAYSRRDSLFRQRLDGDAPRLVGTASEPHSCVWSPNGLLIACASGNRIYPQPTTLFANRAPSAIVVFPATGGPARPVTDRTALNQSPTWSRDGATLYFLSDRQGTRDVYAAAIDSAGNALGTASRLTTGLGAHSIALSSDGRRLTYSVYAERANIWSMPIPARGPVSPATVTAVTTGNQVVEAMRVTRDGQWLLFDSNVGGASQIYRIRLPASAPERLTNDASENFRPDLSPDGTELAYQSWASGSRDVYVQRLDGSAPVPVTATPGQEAGPIWSPDGRSLAFTDISKGPDTYVVTRDSAGRWSPPVGLGVGGPGSADWSPDSRQLIVIATGSVRVIDIASKRDTILYAPRKGTGDPVFEQVVASGDGRTLYLKSHDATGRATIWTMPAAGGAPRPLVRFDDLTRPSNRPDFATDGRRFFFGIQDRQSDVWVADLVLSR